MLINEVGVRSNRAKNISNDEHDDNITPLGFLVSNFIVAFISTIILGFTTLFFIIYLAMIRIIKIDNAIRRRDVVSGTPAQVNGERSDTLETVGTVSRDITTSNVAKPDTSNDTFKYWKRRLSLFTKFEEGIMLDEESFYSVCPEILSVFIANQCNNVKVAVDPFCGAGGNIIQLAKLCDKVIAVDIDPKKIELAKHNASIYGVYQKIEFIVGDFFKLENEIRGDVIVTSPPWGGPSYSRQSVIGPSAIALDKILEVGKKIAPKMLLHLPKNLDKNECLQTGIETGVKICKIENVLIDRYLNSMLFYIRSNNNNSVRHDVHKLLDIHLHNSFHKNERCCKITAYRSYLKNVEKFLNSRC
ncbi:hypothetical protein ACI65C_008336 [Semiaphis heraclei]